MKHLVTGGSGFLGNLIARRLLERGEQVRILDIWREETLPPGLEYVECDIRDQAGVLEACRGIDIVHHNVALVPLTKSGKLFEEVNVHGSRIAAECAAKAGVKAFVHMSSSAIFGSPECPITEATPTRPVEIYGRAKLAGELAVREVSTRTGMPLVVIRPRTILGPGRLGIFDILFDWIREGRKILIIGDGNGLFQFVHANDLMDAYMLVLDQNKPGAYNVGTNRFGTLREALGNLIRHAGTSSRIVSLPVGPTIAALRTADVLRVSPLAPWHYLTYHKPFYFDTKPLEELGWNPKYSNDEMFRECYDEFVAHPPGYQPGPGGTRSAHRKSVKEGILSLVKRLL